jgi:hypothetical protein
MKPYEVLLIAMAPVLADNFTHAVFLYIEMFFS